MAKPKLALIPAAQGTKLYSVLPSDGSGDFDYTRSSSATRINAQGLIESVTNNSSRLNYPLLDGKVVGCPHHILEPQRSNLITYSESFSQSAWNKTRSSVSTNNLISPDGTLNADKLVESSDTGFHAISTTASVTSGVNYTFSIFIKKGSTNFIQILFGTNNVTGNPYVNFDINKGIYQNNGVTSANIENYGNGWYRCSTTFTTATTSITNFISSIQSISDSRASSFTGNVNNNIYIYGAMLEEGSYPTSYIKSNSGSATTRLAETASGSGSAATFNDSEGVLMAEISALANDLTNRQITLSDGTNDNRLVLKYDNQSNIIQSFNRVGGTETAFLSASITDITLFSKCLVKYKVNDYQLWINGFKLDADTSASVWASSTLNDLKLNAGGGADFFGKTKQVQYFDTALTDTQLEELTSWDSFSDMANGQLYTIE